LTTDALNTTSDGNSLLFNENSIFNLSSLVGFSEVINSVSAGELVRIRITTNIPLCLDPVLTVLSVLRGIKLLFECLLLAAAILSLLLLLLFLLSFLLGLVLSKLLSLLELADAI
jgi:hypothetical protein